MSFLTIATKREAFAKLDQLFLRQLKKSVDEKSKPNEAAPGDAEVKTVFSLLLTPAMKREFFLKLVKRHEYWPRLRTLVGSPPYTFLLLGDNDLLNARGITQNRANMAAQNKEYNNISNSHEIGSGQYSDEHGRRYSVVTVEGSDANTTTTLPFRSLLIGRKVVLDVKLPRQKRVRDANDRTFVSMPKRDVVIALQMNALLGSSAVRLRVKGGVRNKDSITARLFCVVVS
jgi:hypothetical protein